MDLIANQTRETFVISNLAVRQYLCDQRTGTRCATNRARKYGATVFLLRLLFCILLGFVCLACFACFACFCLCLLCACVCVCVCVFADVFLFCVSVLLFFLFVVYCHLFFYLLFFVVCQLFLAVFLLSVACCSLPSVCFCSFGFRLCSLLVFSLFFL